MPSISRITPGRGREGDTVVMTGSEFNLDPSRLTIVIDGILVSQPTINVASEEQLSFQIPPGVSTDRHLRVVLTDLDDSEVAVWFWFSKLPEASLPTILPQKIRGHFEEVNFTNPELIEAQDFERFASLTEMVHRELLTSKGDLLSGSGQGLRAVPVGTDGQRLYNGTTQAEWGGRIPHTLTWGRQIAALEGGSEVLLSSNGVDSLPGGAGTAHLVPITGKLLFASVFVASNSPDTDLLTRIRILIDGLPQFDTDDLPSAEQPSLALLGRFLAKPFIDLAPTSRIEIGITKSGTASDMGVLVMGVAA